MGSEVFSELTQETRGNPGGRLRLSFLSLSPEVDVLVKTQMNTCILSIISWWALLSRSLGCAVLIHLPPVQSAAIIFFSYFNLKKLTFKSRKPLHSVYKASEPPQSTAAFLWAHNELQQHSQVAAEAQPEADRLPSHASFPVRTWTGGTVLTVVTLKLDILSLTLVPRR